MQSKKDMKAGFSHALSSSPKRYAFVVDMKRCMGCYTCAMACRSYYQQPLQVEWRKVYPLSPLLYPHEDRAFMSLACNHCTKPACADACPAKAYSIQPDGVVVQDQAKCIGCSNCIRACPYGAPQYNPVLKKAEKCNLCVERLERGLKPVCVQSCPVSALRLVNLLEPDDNATVQYPAGYPMMVALNPSTRFVLPEIPYMVRPRSPSQDQTNFAHTSQKRGG